MATSSSPLTSLTFAQLYQKELNKDRDLKHFGFVMGLFTSFKAAEIISYDYRFMQIDGERYVGWLVSLMGENGAHTSVCVVCVRSAVTRQMRPIQLEVINIEHSPQQEYASFAPVTDLYASSGHHTTFVAGHLTCRVAVFIAAPPP
jgi:hypothetical protein